jgi:anti-sigma B factor antagonist
MTATQTLPSVSPSAAEDEGSAVAITLSWSAEPGSDTTEGDAPPARGSHIVELIGDVDLLLVMRVREILMSLPVQGSDVTVDVSHVRFIDAGGLGMLVGLYRLVRESGGQLRLIGAERSFRRVLRVVRLTFLLAEDSSGR